MAIAVTENQEQRTPLQARVLAVRSERTAIQLRDALPASVSLERFTRATATALMQNPDLATADEQSFFQSLVKCAMDGLLPDGREAALVIYKGKAQYIPMIAGSRKIAAEYGWTIRTHAIYENDEFDVDLGTGRVTHRPPRVGAERGALRGAWAIAHHRDGRESIVEVMDKASIDQAKAVAKTDVVWSKWPAQMYEKTVGHRIAKKLPLDPQDAERLTRVINATELEPGEAAGMLYGPEATFSEIPAGDSAEGTMGGETGPQSPVDAVLAVDEDEPGLAAAGPGSFVPPSGKFSAGGEHGPKTLSEILATGADGKGWLKWALARITEPAEYHDAIWAFAKAEAPAVYQAALAAQEARA